MRITFQIIISALTIIFIGCQSDNSKRLPSETKILTDTIVKAQLVEDLIGKQFNLDSRMNPFIYQKEIVGLKNCEMSKEIAEIFNCITGQFNSSETPIYVGPIPEPDYTQQKVLNDSIFITNCLQDTNFFSEPIEDRVYEYYKGKIIDRTENYILCLILFGFNVGFEYHLCSFTSTGQLISKMEIGAQASDWYEIYGFIYNKKSFEIFKNEFDYKDNNPIVSKKINGKYKILDNGVFVEE
jgi:hypothetical protein